VSAIDSQGRTVATVLTRGKNNGYMLHVQPATYQLVAELSGGLRCEATAVALAHQTVRQNIICPIP
jgi:hypothetical protein